MGIKPRRQHLKTKLSIPNLCPFKKRFAQKSIAQTTRTQTRNRTKTSTEKRASIQSPSSHRKLQKRSRKRIASTKIITKDIMGRDRLEIAKIALGTQAFIF